ncbi:hypothetical protein ACGFSB_28420 [Streptomyces sp. NPDC048441]|uniref:hypothetical protein n=1 Tax=Streptomyces sp. NPDC048441 TaxID=3365552 RepID=UPI00371B4F30
MLVFASLFWVYAAWQLFTSYGSTYNQVDCPSPVNSDPRDLYFEDSSDIHDEALQCASDRSWPKPLAALVVSVPLSGVGAALFTAGTISVRLRHHDDDLQSARS